VRIPEPAPTVTGETYTAAAGWQTFTFTCTSAEHAIRLVNTIDHSPHTRHLAAHLDIPRAARWLHRARLGDIAADPTIPAGVGTPERIAEDLERGTVFVRDDDCLQFKPVPSSSAHFPYDTVKVTLIGDGS
jgi:hypothetical protein